MTNKVKKSRAMSDSSIEHRLTALELTVGHISDQVDNHIPTILAEQNVVLDSIHRKMGDLDAISRFVSVCLKGIVTIATAIWAVKKLLPGVH
jgi:uncharacterized coiled-coil protein SlyX